MIERTCPNCGEKWYSSDAGNNIWICEKCGSEISKSEEKEAENIIPFNEIKTRIKNKSLK